MLEREQRRPKPYAITEDGVPPQSKNKDIQKFQEDVVENVDTLPKVVHNSKNTIEDKKLMQTLEANLCNPDKDWHPSDHSKQFMSNLRKYMQKQGFSLN